MNIILEKNLKDYPQIVSIEKTRIIFNQMTKNICMIFMPNGSKGTGFFCYIPFPDINNLLAVMITNNHIIDEKYLASGQTIKLLINNQIKIIEMNNRIKYTNKIYDTTIIEIKKKDKITDFLYLDNNIQLDDSDELYIGNTIYTIQYPNNQIPSVSYGIISKKSLDHEFMHYCCTESGSSGSPILSLLTNKIIGIHRGTNIKYNHNIGVFLKYPIRELISQNFGNITNMPMFNQNNINFNNNFFMKNDMNNMKNNMNNMNNNINNNQFMNNMNNKNNMNNMNNIQNNNNINNMNMIYNNFNINKMMNNLQLKDHNKIIGNTNSKSKSSLNLIFNFILGPKELRINKKVPFNKKLKDVINEIAKENPSAKEVFDNIRNDIILCKGEPIDYTKTLEEINKEENLIKDKDVIFIPNFKTLYK